MSAAAVRTLAALPVELALVVLGPLNLRSALRRFRAGDAVAGTGLALLAATAAVTLVLLDAARRGVRL